MPEEINGCVSSGYGNITRNTFQWSWSKPQSWIRNAREIICWVSKDSKRDFSNHFQPLWLGSHPHGILCSGTFAAFATEGCEWAKVFPGVVPNLLTLEGFHQMPGFREILSFSGTCAATSKSMDYLLSKPKGRAVILVVGGAREVLCQDQDRIDLIILNRKGFIKKALKHGSALVPTFSFGEAFIYGKLFPNPRGSWIRSFQEYIVDKTRWPFPFFSGRGIFQYSFGMLPRRYPITVVSKLIYLVPLF